MANKLVGDITNDSAHLHIKSMDFTRWRYTSRTNQSGVECVCVCVLESVPTEDTSLWAPSL